MSVAKTSIDNYHNYPIKGKHEDDQLKRVVAEIKKSGRPLSGREISASTGIENSSVARTLNNLKKAQEKGLYKEIEVTTDKCNITKITVQHYGVVSVDKNNQVNMFQ